MIYGKYAKRFKDAGLVVTPLRGKAPVIKDWEATTPETVTLESRYDKMNMGLLTGKPSGIICADIDCDDDSLSQKLYELLPETPVMKKGKKGINFFYKYTGEETIKIHNPINKRKVEFELISTGRQTVIPTSIHPESGQAYIWCNKSGEKSKKNLLNVEVDSLPTISKETLESIRSCINAHFESQRKEIADRKVQSGVAGLISNYDKIGHKDLPDYNPKSKSDIPEGYRDRCRSGSHDAIVSFMMALINKGHAKEQVITEAMKYDQDYNLGYSNTYFTCRTCKAKGETPWQKAEYYYESSYKTVKEKKEQAGEVMPVESDIAVQVQHKEMEAVNRVLKDYGIHYDDKFLNLDKEKKDNLVLMKEGKKDFFAYDGKMWKHCEQSFLDYTYRRFNNLMGMSKSHNQITAAQSKFIAHIPQIPRKQSFFKMSPYQANLANGTLHLEGLQKPKLVFKPHNKYDLLTDIINLDYGTGKVNTEFEEMLERITNGDKDKYYAIQEMFALALMPVAARIFFLYGVSGSGKSTIGKIISYFIGEHNLCGVDPSSFDGFNMESMVNKKVNMDMDIAVARPISDGQFKKIEDRNPVRIRRKGKEDIYASIPALHIFGANTLPKNFDGASGAYDRRITIIKFDRSFTDNGQKYDRDYAYKVYQSCQEGILNFALAGLQRLIDNKFSFTVPTSGKEAMEEWTLENDPVGLFLKDLKNDEVVGVEKDPCIDKDQRIPKMDLWRIFEKWLQDAGRKHSKITRTKFYKLIEGKGYQSKRFADNNCFLGIGYVKDTTNVENVTSEDYGDY